MTEAHREVNVFYFTPWFAAFPITFFVVATVAPSVQGVFSAGVMAALSASTPTAAPTLTTP